MSSFLIFLFCIFSINTLSADDNQERISSKKEAIMDLSKSLEEGKSDEELARDYEKLAKEFVESGELAKAEENLKKARNIYDKLKDKKKLSEVERELAKIQEAQNKTVEAISNYNQASVRTKDVVQNQININDAKRLENRSNPQKQSKYIQENIELFDKTQNYDERASAYQQMANVNIALGKDDEAVANLEYALEDVKDKPIKSLEISREIAQVYVQKEDLEKAIEINEKLVEKTKDIPDAQTKIEQLQKLSQVYSENKDTEKAISVLLESYNFAIEEGRTLDAKKSMELLIEQYEKTNDKNKILDLYHDFNSRLENLIKSDNTLVDSKVFQSIEERIAHLEKERELKDELIKRKNTLNYILIASIILILIFTMFIIKTLYSINKKNKEIALQSLRREMNPHFIFNSLNSVNQFIAQNNELEANKYLSSYSKLMRNIMENSNKDFIPLSVEVAQLKEYLQLEHMRFQDKFDYTINVDETLDADAVYVPNMLIQPQLENAVWHGLRYKGERGILSLSIVSHQNEISITIEDNGIGIKRSQELKTARQKEHQSRGLTNTNERIALLNSLYHTNIKIEIIDKKDGETGVIVKITFPEIKK